MKTTIVEKHAIISKIVLFLFLLENTSFGLFVSASIIPEHRVGEEVSNCLVLESIIELASNIISKQEHFQIQFNIFQLHLR